MDYPFWLVHWLVHSGFGRFSPTARRLLGAGTRVLPHLSDRSLATPVRSLEQFAEHWQLRAPEAMDLTQAAPSFDLTPSGSTKLPADRRLAPPVGGLPELRELIAEHLRDVRRQTVAGGEEVLVTSGATGALQLILDTCLNAGERVLLFDPCSPFFILPLRQRRARIRWVATECEDGYLQFDVERFRRAMAGSKLLLLSQPNNPTGGLFKPEDVEQIAWWAHKYDVLVINDESFARYDYDGALASVGDAPHARARTFTLGSISQGWAQAAARVGWLTAHPHWIRPLLAQAALSQPFVPTICQQIAGSSLHLHEASFASIRANFARKRQYAYERLRTAGLAPTWPKAGYFCWVETAPHWPNGRAAAAQLMAEEQVLVTPGDAFGPSGANRVRVGCAIEDGRLQEGLDRLARAANAPGERSGRALASK